MLICVLKLMGGHLDRSKMCFIEKCQLERVSGKALAMISQVLAYYRLINWIRRSTP